MKDILDFINSSSIHLINLYMGHPLCARYHAKHWGYKDETGIAFPLGDIPAEGSQLDPTTVLMMDVMMKE